MLSFWHRGNATQVIVYLTASSGEKTIKYFEDPGTNDNDGNGNVEFYLNDGFAFDTDDWMRFERNIEADYEAHAGGASWTNTDGLGFPLSSGGLIHEDEIRLSNSLTVEFNTLGPGVIGHIMRNRTWDATTLARTDRWFHYDQVGTVISTTDADGSAAATNWFDAFGNRLENWETGLVASGGGWCLHSKNRDPLAAMHYMSQRWYAADLGVFASEAPYPPMLEHGYSFARRNPIWFVDPDGRRDRPREDEVFMYWEDFRDGRNVPADIRNELEYLDPNFDYDRDGVRNKHDRNQLSDEVAEPLFDLCWYGTKDGRKATGASLAAIGTGLRGIPTPATQAAGWGLFGLASCIGLSGYW